MSTLYTSRIACAGCGEQVSLLVADSLNANRMPDARVWVIERSLLTAACKCGHRTTAVKPLLYTDFDRGLWVQAMPEEYRPRYEVLESQVQDGFAAAFDTTRFPRFIQVYRDRLRPRLTFGYEELREKVVAADHGLDDALIEILKLELFVVQTQLLRNGVQLLTLDAADDDHLRFRFYVFPPEGAGEVAGELAVARAAYDALLADIERLRGLYPALFGGTYVNTLRYRFASDGVAHGAESEERT